MPLTPLCKRRVLTRITARRLRRGPSLPARVDDAIARAAKAARVDVVAYVGCSATGRSIAKACAGRGAKALLENGGNDALIVDDGVDPKWAAAQSALGALRGSGRVCVSIERASRSFYPPTVLNDCTPQMLVTCDDTFGPVAPVRVVPDFETALTEAAADRYGLSAAVLTNDMAHAQEPWRRLPVGHREDQRRVRRAPGGAAQPRRASGFGIRLRLRLRPGTARRDDRGQGGARVSAGVRRFSINEVGKGPGWLS